MEETIDCCRVGQRHCCDLLVRVSIGDLMQKLSLECLNVLEESLCHPADLVADSNVGDVGADPSHNTRAFVTE